MAISKNLKKWWLVLCILVITGVFSVNAVEKTAETIDPELWQKALKIHDEAIVIDTHTDTPMATFGEDIDLGKKQERLDVDFVKMQDGGLDAVFFAAYVSNRMDEKQPSKYALALIDEVYRQVEMNSDIAQLAFTPQDIRDIHKQGKRAVLVGMENGGPVEDSLALLRTYYRLGVRYITLTHGSNNQICDSATADEPKWNGLSPFGKQVVKEMNRLGMLIDVSHISDKAFFDVIEVSSAPVFASHSCARALCDVSRNMTDEMIKTMAKKGGVIHITFVSGFVSQEFKEKSSALRKKLEPQREKLKKEFKDDRRGYWRAYMKLWKAEAPQRPSMDDLIDHIDHVVKLVGIDHVGLGSDYDGASSYPQGLGDASTYPVITYHLLKRGYSETDIKKILGGNFLRFFGDVINTAKKLN